MFGSSQKKEKGLFFTYVCRYFCSKMLIQDID